MSQQHRTELLEAEIRRLRQALRIVSNAVLAGDREAMALALEAKKLLDQPR